MKIDKQLVKQRFLKSLPTYEANAVIQQSMAKTLVGLLGDKKYNSVLELGCGTGFLTKELVCRYEFSQYYAVDIVDKCADYMAKISDKIRFVVCDIESIDMDMTFDLIISNAVLQWVNDLEGFIKSISANLNSGGVFALTLFGKDNYKEFRPFVGETLHYYTLAELEKICQDYNIDILKDEILELSFDSPKDVLRHIQKTGVNAVSNSCWTKSDLNRFKADYPCADGDYKLTYHPIYIVMRKK